ncbi:type IV secretion protein Rhs [Escherichia coli]
MGKPDVTDSNLKNIIDNLYRPNAKVGSGSTADAVRYKLATGEKVGGRGHVLKAQDYTRALQDWLDKNPTASQGIEQQQTFFRIYRMLWEASNEPIYC